MTSKCGENKKVAHEAIAECVTVVHILTTPVIYCRTDARQRWNLFVLYNKERFCVLFSGARLRPLEFKGLFTWSRLTGLARLPRWNWFLFIWRLSARFPRSRLEKRRSRQPSQPALSYEHVEIFLKGSRDVPRSRKPGQPGQPGSYEEALSHFLQRNVGFFFFLLLEFVHSFGKTFFYVFVHPIG